jgi:dienelactone hydrolase
MVSEKNLQMPWQTVDIYAVGYCFGAKYVLLLAGEHPDTVAWGQASKDEEQGAVKPATH